MNVLLYTGKQKRLGSRLKKIIEANAPSHEIEVFSSIEQILGRLHRHMYDVDATILLLKTRSELDAMLTAKESLYGVRVVVVLSHADRETVSKAHRLSPRFVGFAEEGFEDVAAVLAKMLGRGEKPKRANRNNKLMMSGSRGL